MGNFTGQLSSNEIFSAIWNMIISQQVFADNIKGNNSELVERARVDGSLYGSTKLYYATDTLKSYAWGNDAEAANLLQLHRPAPPKVQAIELNVFRQIPVTIDNYLSKRAWSEEGSFMVFNGVTLGWMGDTKRIYDKKTYNAFIGTNKTNVGSQNLTCTLDKVTTETGADKIGVYQLRATQIGKFLEDMFDEMADANRDYNDYSFLREVDKSECTIVFNSKYANEIRYIDLPGIFHNDGILPTIKKMPAKFFGDINTSGGTVAASNKTIRSLIETDYTVSTTVTHVFPGDLLPDGAVYLANTTYTENANIICKVMSVLPPYMSAFEVETVFFNPRSLTENHYLTFGRNTLEHFSNYPFITISEDVVVSGS